MARPREFDEKEVLNKAMELFWQQGYEKTSMQDLVNCMGIHRRSIYDTFGDKHTLFMRALSHYIELTEARIKHDIKSELTVKQAIQKLFEIFVYPNDKQPKGCFIVNTAVELSLLNQEIAEKVAETFLKIETIFFNLLKYGQEQGEIHKHSDIKKLSQFIHNSFVGIIVLAKTTNDKTKLETIIDLNLSILD